MKTLRNEVVGQFCTGNFVSPRLRTVVPEMGCRRDTRGQIVSLKYWGGLFTVRAYLAAEDVRDATRGLEDMRVVKLTNVRTGEEVLDTAVVRRRTGEFPTVGVVVKALDLLDDLD